MRHVARSEDYLNLPGNLLKCPKSSRKNPEDTIQGQQREEPIAANQE